MGALFKNLGAFLCRADEKCKRIIDLIYLFGLVFYLAAKACALSRLVYVDFVSLFMTIGTVVFFIVGVYRIVIELARNRKKALIAIALVVFGIVYSLISPEASDFPIIALAIAGGMGVSADSILLSGIISNFILIMNNVFMVVFSGDDAASSYMGENNFFFLGGNRFSFPIMNNCSSTDFAAHYFWITAAFLWLRGRKLTWGEILAVASVDAVVYALTGSNTTFIGISMMLVFALYMKLYLTYKNGKLKSGKKEGNGVLSKVAGAFDKFVVFCARFSFVIFAAFTIATAYLFNVGNPFLLKLNNILHLRVSLGHRGIIENGIHLFASDVPVYGAFSSADGYYNFLDCSYVSILVICGLIPLLFYLASMTGIMFKHKDYRFGLVLLAVCALVCVEEQHLAELSNNFFLLLLFADFSSKTAIDAKKKAGDKNKLVINLSAVALSVAMSVVTGLVYYPRYQAKNDLDRLDAKSADIYDAIQSNIQLAASDGLWKPMTDSVNSFHYGDVLEEPDDFASVSGSSWADYTRDPKSHAFYSIYYDSDRKPSDNPVTAVMITDEVRDLIGDGSIVVEYDVVEAKVYSVWYSESHNCLALSGAGARDFTRAARLKTNVVREGYSTGGKHA